MRKLLNRANFFPTYARKVEENMLVFSAETGIFPRHLPIFLHLYLAYFLRT